MKARLLVRPTENDPVGNLLDRLEDLLKNNLPKDRGEDAYVVTLSIHKLDSRFDEE